MAARRMNPQQMGMGQPPQMRPMHPGAQGPRGMPQPGMHPEHEEMLNDPMAGQHGQMVSSVFVLLCVSISFLLYKCVKRRIKKVS